MSILTDIDVSPSRIKPHPIYHPIYLREGELIIRNLVHAADKLQAYRLRNEIFCKELGWTLQSRNGLEVDEYDKDAVFFGVLSKEGQLLAFVRVIPSEKTFMIENEFLSLVDPLHRVRKESDTVEVSRLCVHLKSRNKVAGNFGMHYVSMLLFKGVYQWCLVNHIRHLYAVTESKVHKSLCLRGLPFRLVGKPYTMPDGVVAVASIISLKEWADIRLQKSRTMLAWFNSV